VWGATDSLTAAAWTYGGVALSFVPYSGSKPTSRTDTDGTELSVESPMYFADIMATTPAVVAAATIPVEKTAGPILMLAGEADDLWPSCALAKYAADRLMMTGHSTAHADELVCYPDAGHMIPEVGLPTAEAHRAFAFNEWLSFGGTTVGIAHAARAQEARIRAFLHDSLGGRTAAIAP
jgi:hypothetical protein